MALAGVPTRALHGVVRIRNNVAELHWRLALPIMARGHGASSRVPLARLRPRQGRYARVGFAILIFFIYIELAIAGKALARARRRCPSG